MAIYNLGRILPFFKGDYVEGETYKKLDLVYVKGVGTYVANQTTSEYPVDNEEWTLVCENGKKGDKGDGITEEEARTIIEAYNYITMQDVEDKGFTTISEVEAKGYTTMAEVEAKGYLTEVPSEYVTETELEDKNYTTMSEVEAKGYLTEVPAGYATETWVEDKNYTTMAEVEAKNYLTEVPSEYITETELTSKNYTTMAAVENKGYTTMSAVESKSYTTMSAVEAKGYLTQVPAGYATETWVEGKNYLTEHQPLKTINNESIVGTGDIEIKGGGGLIIIDKSKPLTDDEFDDIKEKVGSGEYSVALKSGNEIFYADRYHYMNETILNFGGVANDPNTMNYPFQWRAKFAKGDFGWYWGEEALPMMYEANMSKTYNQGEYNTMVMRLDKANYVIADFGSDKWPATYWSTTGGVVEIHFINDNGTNTEHVINRLLQKGNIYEWEETVRELVSENELESKGYTTMSAVEAKNYTTMSAVESKGYLTEVPSEYITETELNSKNYTTMADVEAKNYLTEVPSEYITETELEAKNYTTMSEVEAKNYLTQVPAGYATETWVEGKNYLTEHQKLKTINNESIVGDGNIEIKGGGSPVVNLTQAEYDELETKDPNTLYNITDAESIDINNYYTKTEANARYNPILSTTASTSGYKFPKWNVYGQIDGTTATAYQASYNINGTARTIYSTSSTALTTVYAPTSAGTPGQILTSNGSGAPVWKTPEAASATMYISEDDCKNGVYSTEIRNFYNKCINKSYVTDVQIYYSEDPTDAQQPISYYLPSSTRIYRGNVELWLFTTEDGKTWQNEYILITSSEVTTTITTGTFA